MLQEQRQVLESSLASALAVTLAAFVCLDGCLWACHAFTIEDIVLSSNLHRHISIKPANKGRGGRLQYRQSNGLLEDVDELNYVFTRDLNK